MKLIGFIETGLANNQTHSIPKNSEILSAKISPYGLIISYIYDITFQNDRENRNFLVLNSSDTVPSHLSQVHLVDSVFINDTIFHVFENPWVF